MKTVYESKFYDFCLDEEANCIYFLWKDETQNMTADDFKEGTMKYAEYCEQYNCDEIAVDLRHFKGNPGPEVLNDWTAQALVPQFNKIGIKKFAFLKDQNTQGYEVEGPHKNEGEEYETAIFDSEDQMKQWLKR